MSTIVATLTQAQTNLRKFESELVGSAELRRRLAFARAWYADQADDGQWLFAPSKFCGYKDMTAAEYTDDTDTERDGRRTEKQLQTWFTTIAKDDALYAELSEQLFAFLGRFGKPPSAAIRINVTNEHLLSREAATSASGSQPIVDLVIAVGSRLSAADRARIRAAL